jgi:hypothetical protein
MKFMPSSKVHVRRFFITVKVKVSSADYQAENLGISKIFQHQDAD